MKFLIVLVRAILISLLPLAGAKAATITVFDNGDSGAGTLRQAIFDASSGDTIIFAANIVEVALTSNELLITKNLTINGRGADKLDVRNTSFGSFRIFRIAPSVTAVISGLTIQSGRVVNQTGQKGGGILNHGTLTLSGCAIVGNTTNGSGDGGGIANEGVLTITNSTVSGNSAGSGNSNPFFGGGIANTGALTIVNSTISDNRAPENLTGSGGGIANISGGVSTIASSTISGNASSGNNACGGGIFNDAAGSVTLRSTIIALNDAPGSPDICGTITSQNFNLVGISSGGTIANPQSFDQIGTTGAPIDPLLGALQNNGGPTFTRALQSNSVAIDHGDPNSGSRDQRGYLRAGFPDIGAFEFRGTVPVSLANISTRLPVQTGDNVLIGGFIVTGSQPKKIMVRGLGPSLPLTGVLANPILELRSSSGLIAVNDNWRSDQEAEIAATSIPPSNDLESAIVATVPANNSAYTAVMRGVNGGTGTGIVEVYDLNRTVDSKLGNISTRGFVLTGDDILIGGLIVVGEDPVKVIVRGIGPSLFLSGKLANPTLELRDASGNLLSANDNWRSDQEAEIIATTLQPGNDLESAIVRTLMPGNYTAILRGVNDGTGIAVVEAYGLY
jgi:hypothetical protein